MCWRKEIPQNKNTNFYTSEQTHCPTHCVLYKLVSLSSKYQIYLDLFTCLFLLYGMYFIYLKSLLRQNFVQVLRKNHINTFSLLAV